MVSRVALAGTSPIRAWHCGAAYSLAPLLLPAGNLVGLLLSPLILQHFGWRALFYLFGFAGIPLLVLWMLVVPNAPPPAPASGAGSSGGSSSVTLRQLMSKRATWAIIIANFGEDRPLLVACLPARPPPILPCCLLACCLRA